MSELDIPESWAKATFGQVAQIVMGQSPPGKTYNTNGKGIPLINGPVEFSSGSFGLTRINQYTTEATKLCKAGDLLLCVRGSTTGRTNIASTDACIGRGVAAIRTKGVLPAFLNWCVAHSKAYILGVSTGSTFPNISLDRIAAAPVSVPPLAEQRRIVAKIESTFARIDAIEKAVTEAEALLAKYRASLLNKAFRGQLVPQDPNDEPASKLLERIRAERAKAIKDGKIRKSKKDDLPPITEDEIPFEIPKSWEWVRLGNILDVHSGENLTAINQSEGEIPVYGGNGIAGYHSIPNLNETHIVIGRVGAKCGVVHVTPQSSWVTDNALIVEANYGCIDLHWLALTLRFLNLNSLSNSSAQPVISGAKIYQVPIPFPALAEQVRLRERLQAHENEIEVTLMKVMSASKTLKKVNEAILQVAFSGRLVPQDPAEGTGQELLAQIMAQRAASAASEAPPKRKSGRRSNDA